MMTFFCLPSLFACSVPGSKKKKETLVTLRGAGWQGGRGAPTPKLGENRASFCAEVRVEAAAAVVTFLFISPLPIR
jgi:hypothetical protein